MHLECYTGSGGIECSMATRDCEHQLLGHPDRIEGYRVGEDTRWSVATERESAAGGANEQCSRVEVVVGDGEVEGPAERGEDDAA